MGLDTKPSGLIGHAAFAITLVCLNESSAMRATRGWNRKVATDLPIIWTQSGTEMLLE